MEDAFWSGLKEMAQARGLKLSHLASEIEASASTAISPRPCAWPFWLTSGKLPRRTGDVAARLERLGRNPRPSGMMAR
ncbi:ribbon-helix-helix domain-containing protein [Tardiphaga sp.]|uniref:ribbon-helix-helix domain-containing protein n=1 Tax=Tardiphaga sp. TaxID=1926292 RepID=UPI0037DA0E03